MKCPEYSGSSNWRDAKYFPNFIGLEKKSDQNWWQIQATRLVIIREYIDPLGEAEKGLRTCYVKHKQEEMLEIPPFLSFLL